MGAAGYVVNRRVVGYRLVDRPQSAAATGESPGGEGALVALRRIDTAA